MTEGTTPPAITLDMSIAEVVSRFPQTLPVFSRHGAACAGCSVAAEDALAQAAQAHGVDAAVLMADLNAGLLRPGR